MYKQSHTDKNLLNGHKLQLHVHIGLGFQTIPLSTDCVTCYYEVTICCLCLLSDNLFLRHILRYGLTMLNKHCINKQLVNINHSQDGGNNSKQLIHGETA